MSWKLPGGSVKLGPFAKLKSLALTPVIAPPIGKLTFRLAVPVLVTRSVTVTGLPTVAEPTLIVWVGDWGEEV
jgi:hypothetical protein